MIHQQFHNINRYSTNLILRASHNPYACYSEHNTFNLNEVTMLLKTIPWQRLRNNVGVLIRGTYMLQHNRTPLAQYPYEMVPHVNVLAARCTQ